MAEKCSAGRLEEVRRKLGIPTQKGLAELLNITPEWYSRIVNGHSDLSQDIALRLSELERTSVGGKVEESSIGYGIPSGRMVAPLHPRSPVPHSPTRADCHDYINKYLDQAEEIPGAVARAYLQMQLYLPLAELERLKLMEDGKT